jgi:prevent-host-death family protein
VRTLDDLAKLDEARSMRVNIHESKTNLSNLLELVEHGEEVILCRAGKPVAKLVPYKQTHLPRKPGALKGQLWIAEDFDELPPGIEAAFRGQAD